MTNEAATLRERLARERDPFQRNCLFQALCEANDELAAVQFMRELDGSAVRRALRRGCFLHRYGNSGDLPAEPVLDVPQTTDWTSAQQGFLAEVRKSDSSVDRQLLLTAFSLYTFFDFCVTRGEQVHGADAELLAELAESIWNSRAIPAEIAARVLSMAAICTTEV